MRALVFENSLPRGGVDIVYDTVTTAAPLEVGVRVTRTRGHVVCLGVEIPRRFEWTPLYFKELSLVGSNAFGIEQLEGRRLHAMECYFEPLRRHAVDPTPIITHRFRLEEYRQAFLACRDQGAAGAVKVLFDYRARPRRPPGMADSDARGDADDGDHLL